MTDFRPSLKAWLQSTMWTSKVMNRRTVLMLIGTAPVAFVGACAYGPGYGPPPHAPAWGRRRKMVWDPLLGVYVVAGVPDTYYAEPFTTDGTAAIGSSARTETTGSQRHDREFRLDWPRSTDLT